MASVDKISISVPDDDLAWARKRAKAKKLSLSAVVSQAIKLSRQLEARERVLRNLPESTPEALAAIDREWA